MKKLTSLFFAALISATAFADGLPVFNATLTMGKASRFVLIGADGRASSWLQVGDTFDGYTLKSYDAKASTLEVEKGGTVSVLKLASDAAVAAGALAPVPATLADAQNVLNKMHFEEMLSRAINRQTGLASMSIDNQMKRAVAAGVSREDAMAFREKVMAEMKNVMDPARLKDDMQKIYSEVFSKAELDSMAAFYSTPMGESIANKQSDVQDRIGAIVGQRMQETMPKIQALGKQFQEEQQAKKKAAAAAAQPAPAPAAPAPATP